MVVLAIAVLEPWRDWGTSMGDMADRLMDEAMLFMMNTWWEAFHSELEMIFEDGDEKAIQVTVHAWERLRQRATGWTATEHPQRLAFEALRDGVAVDDAHTSPNSTVRVVHDGYTYVFRWNPKRWCPALVTMWKTGNTAQKLRDMNCTCPPVYAKEDRDLVEWCPTHGSHTDDEIDAMFEQERRKAIRRLKQDWHDNHDLPDDEDLGICR